VIFDTVAYDQIRAGCQSSAAVIVPMLQRWFAGIETVVDVGAGEGWFAAEFASRGVTVLAVEHPIPDPRSADVRFVDVDLAQGMPAIGPFDLALCLEVAEHLPEEGAIQFVEQLCTLAPIVVFSAAIPGQGGHGHVNEQWPDYWAQRFELCGYVGSGMLRYEIWDDDRVEPWYRQNLLVFASATDSTASELALFVEGIEGSGTLPLVHPEIYGWRVRERDEALGGS